MDKRTRAKFSSIAARIGDLEQGVGGGYYTPTVDSNGNLTWEASKSNMPSVDGANIKGPKGDTGATGAQGSPGTAGKGVPTGGTAGQVLAKVNSTDYNTQWVDPPGGSGTVDSTMTQETYTTFDGGVVSDGTVVVVKKLGWCQVYGYVKLADTVSAMTNILDSAKVPAPQTGVGIYDTAGYWTSSYTRLMRVGVGAGGSLRIMYGAAGTFWFSITYPVA